MFGGREKEPLLGIFSTVWAFETSLPSRCPENNEIHCGLLEAPLPRPLRKFLGVPKNKSFPSRLNVFTTHTEEESLARISIEVDRASAVFLVTTRKIAREGETERVFRRMRGERTFSDGTGEIEPHAEQDREYLNALREVIRLLAGRFKEFSEVNQLLVCRTCPAQVSRLPGTVV